MHGRGRSRGARAVAAAAIATSAALVALVPGAASGDPPDGRAHIDGYPAISGTPQVGQTLTASATWSPSDADAHWSWLRCSSTGDVDRCVRIRGADASSYRLVDADVGSYLRALLVVTSDQRSGDDRRTTTAYAYSAPDGPVRARPVPTPAPTPVPTPVAPAPTPPPPVVTPPPGSGQVLGEHKTHKPRMMRPRPVVRIRGWLTPSGARVTLLTVRAPRGARVKVRCFGASCPRRHWARTTSLLHLVPFERRLRAGTRLVISVTKRGYIGKRTVLELRRGRQPRRVDRCLYPGSTRARRCPSG